MTGPAQKINAAEDLDGVRLADGWSTTTRVPDRPGATGGNFSITYFAKHDDGRDGFCKVLNYQMAFTSADPAGALQGLVEAYNFERDLLKKCGDDRLSRIVLSVGDGQFQRAGFTMPTVSYLIFEVAEGDVRKVLDRNPGVDTAAKFRWLHHAATGLQQLHSRGVAHQDVKPSNLLIFPSSTEDNGSGKIGDLGRATDPERPMWHDSLSIAGDATYAPPEQLYRATPIEFGPRRLACDLYQLGSVAAFLLSGSPMNGLLTLELHPAHHWSNWSATYADVLPFVRDAYGRALDRIAKEVSDTDLSKRSARLIAGLCDPDPNRRGHAAGQKTLANPYALQRIVAEFDLLSRRARIAAVRGVL